MQPYDIGNQHAENAVDVASEVRDWLRSGVLSGKIDDNAIGGLDRLLVSDGRTPEDALAFAVHTLFFIQASQGEPELLGVAEAFAQRTVETLEAATGIKGQEFDWRFERDPESGCG